jgi:regulatory protein
MRKSVRIEPRERATKTPEQALQSLMSLCAKAERSTGDAMRLMSRWGVEPDRRAWVLRRLVEGRFIDDERYAGAYVREKSSLAGWGAHKIRAALAAKGVSREIIENAVGQIITETSANKLSELLSRKMRSTKASTPYGLRGKLLRYGLARGFGYEQVKCAVNELVKDNESDE